MNEKSAKMQEIDTFDPSIVQSDCRVRMAQYVSRRRPGPEKQGRYLYGTATAC
jgi:hypothetical protein